MLQGVHSAILSTFIKLPFVIKIFVLLIFEWPFYTDFTQVLHRFYTGFIQALHNFTQILLYLYCHYDNASSSTHTPSSSYEAIVPGNMLRFSGSCNNLIQPFIFYNV